VKQSNPIQNAKAFRGATPAARSQQAIGHFGVEVAVDFTKSPFIAFGEHSDKNFWRGEITL